MNFFRRAEDPYKCRYFHGRITREEAEKRLKDAGCSSGLFLLREKLLQSDSYSLSLAFNGTVYHYSLDRQSDGTVAIEQGKHFKGPVEFVQHHQVHLDGLLSKLLKPCNLPPGKEPEAFEGMSQRDLRESINQAAFDMGIDDLPEDQMVRVVLNAIHTQKPWFHSNLTRDAAAEKIAKSGFEDGKFLVREKEDAGSFAISVCHKGTVYHYKIDKNDRTGKLSIQDGQKFDSLFLMVDHYSKKCDGLLTTLKKPVVNERNRKRSVRDERVRAPARRSVGDTSTQPGWAGGSASRQGFNIPVIRDQIWDEPDQDVLPSRPLPPPPSPTSRGAAEEIYGSSVSNQEKIYDRVAKKKKSTTLDHRNLRLMNQLGKGNFGSVVKGNYHMDGQDIPVAVKTLKQEAGFPNNTSEIMKEAGLMARLDHPYIVRMIGMCQGDEGVMMLVLELAELGPLNKYLKSNLHMRLRNILEIMYQVAGGMQYLEEQQFVHRDLAARNVLLVTETYAKISDFGMSKALGIGSDYYVAEAAGKWPLKWYAPECIYRFKFSSKGDVWSYGVTLWEALSFGKKPYARMKGQQILDMIEGGQRLDRPEKCPEEVYRVMKLCWEFEAKDRPHFKDVGREMKQVLTKVKRGEIRLVQ